MKSNRILILLFLVVLSGCTLFGDGDEKTNDEWAASSSSPIVELDPTPPEPPPAPVETKNVSYVGVVRPLGKNINNEGTHRLVLARHESVLLEGDGVDLNGYVGEKAQLHGSVRSTKDGKAMIMRVEEVTLFREDVASSSSSSKAAETDTVAVESSSSSAKPIPEKPIEETKNEPDPKEPVAEDNSGASRQPLTSEQETQVVAMAAENYAPERWTQPPYCSSHIGFCIPIHKNWWFNSFGNTTNHLWHVELSNQAIENMGDGLITVQLLNGSLTTVSDKTVQVEGEFIVGYRNWTNNRHFEIVADKRLEAPVRYLTEQLTNFVESAE